MFFTIATLILPVLTLTGVGVFCREKGILRPSAIADIKNLISHILLPAVLFYSLFSIEFSLKVVLLAALCFAMGGLSLGFGFLTRRAAKVPEYYPFLLSGFEVGMLGYALFSLLFGQDSLGYLASMDAGGCLYFFCLYLPLLQGHKEKSARATLKSIFSEPTIIGCLAGLFLSITGLGALLRASAIWPALDAVFSLLTQAVTPLTLIIVGYGLTFRKETLGAVVKTSLIRVAVMAVICGLSILLLKALGLLDTLLLYSVLFICSLSSPYGLSIYATDQTQSDYVNTQLSLYTIVTFTVFILLSILK